MPAGMSGPPPRISAGTSRRAAALLGVIAVLLLLAAVAPPGSAAPLAATRSTPSLPAVRVLQDSVLSSDLFCQSLYIAPGVTLTTDGHLIACTGEIVNRGLLAAGSPSPATASPSARAPASSSATAGSSPVGNFYDSYGGSGGGGESGGCGAGASQGYATRAPGGAGNNLSTRNATNGSTPTPPTLRPSTIRAWYVAGLQNFLEGAAGEATCNIPGGPGSYGVYLQGAKVVVGTVDAAGSPGQGTCTGVGLSGSGGGGVVLIAYGHGGYTAGTVSVLGGARVPSCGATIFSGAGGNGSLVLLHYTTPKGPVNGPVVLLSPYAVGRCASLSGTVANTTAASSPGKTTVLWGDGAKTTGRFPVRHTYPANGTYHFATLTPFASGNVSVVYGQVRLPGPGSPTAPSVQLAPVLLQNLSATLYGLVDVDACGPGHLHPYTIAWGDHTTLRSYLPATHLYAASGSYRVCLNATDSFGLSTRSCENVTIP